jgi:hypothetical protein
VSQTLPITGFDVRAYAREATRVDRSAVDVEAFRAAPLEPSAVNVLRYLRAVERSTIQHLRDVLVTPSHTDPHVTAFLTTWAYEEFWFADALTAIIDVHPEPPTPHRRHHRTPVARARSELADRTSPIWNAVSGNLVGEEFVAAHMTWCALDTWLAQAVYARLIQRTGHPALGTVLTPILEAKGVHLDFYRSEAGVRLQASAWARRFTRFAVRHRWSPSANVPAPSDVFRYVLDDRRGHTAIVTIDLLVAGLPGLSGLHPVGSAMGRLGIGPRARRPYALRS